MSEKVVFVDRRGTDCGKWDDLTPKFGEEGLTAMWVADMDFKVPQAVIDAEKQYLDMGAFGYYRARDSYFDAFIEWEKKYHHYDVKREWIRFAPGVVPAINWFLHIKTKPGDSVIVMTPVYYPFMDAVNNNGRNLVTSELINNDGVYSIDFADFEKKIIDNNVKVFVMSSPHNPVGRIWRKDELQKVMEICKKHNVFVISDEIHHDLVNKGFEQITTATVGEYDDILVTVTAASKTFNLAACQNSFVVIPNEQLRNQYDEYTSQIRVTSGTPFGYLAVEAAYRGGREWLEQVMDIIYSNATYVTETLTKELPGVKVSPLEGTYLLWIDFSAYLKGDEIQQFMQKKCKLAFDYGDWFGGEKFATFVRMNLATSREIVEKAVKAIVENLKK